MTRSAAPTGPCGSRTPSRHEASSKLPQSTPISRVHLVLRMFAFMDVSLELGISAHNPFSMDGSFPGGNVARATLRSAAGVRRADTPAPRLQVRLLLPAQSGT